MGKPKYIEEVVNEEQVSETPAVLVAPAEKPDQLSPNPANSGFTKQLFVDSLPETGEPNVIYVTPKQAAGGVVGYKNYKWDITSKKWERVLGSDPALKVLNGGQGVVDNEVNPPKKAPEKVFTGEVVFNQEPTIEGKKLHDWVDSEGGVTQEELNTALGNYYKKTETYSKTEVNDALALKQDKLDNTSAPTGVVVKLLGFDSQGHVVNDDVPEGIVVDDALDNESTNAVSNKAVSDVLAEAYDSTKTYNENDFVIYDGDYYKCKANSVTGAWDSSKWTAYAIGQELSELENKKANVDGNYPTMTVGVADQLSPYDEESGDDQDEPFSFQATGTGNGTQPDFATGAIALIKEKQGNTVCVNQGVKTKTVDSSGNGITFVSNGDYEYTITVENPTNYYQITLNNYDIIEGHKYLLINGSIRENNVDIEFYIGDQPGQTQGRAKYEIVTGASGGSKSIYLYVGSTTPNGIYKIKPQMIDLTQWFNGDIPQDLLDNPENFFRYYQGSLAYNEGELVNANGRYIKCIGMNQWDEETKVVSSHLENKNPIKVIPNRDYYFEGPVTTNQLFGNGVRWLDKDGNVILTEYFGRNTYHKSPANARYVNIALTDTYGTTYNHDISINLYYEDEARCLTYEPYEVLTNNDTGTEVLRSAGSVKDIKTPDGTITRYVGYVDLSTLDWEFNGNIQAHVASLPTIKPSTINVVADKYYYDANFYLQLTNGGMSVTETGQIRIRTGSQSTTPTGYLYYELATPTTEQGTPFSENLVIDDFGSQEFSGTNGVPQGCKIFYPVDYKAFIDTLYDYTEGTPSNIALKSDLAVVDNKIGAKIPECPTTTDGTYVLKATVNDGEVVYNWVLEE